jgi:hypothetical protein
MGEFVVNRMLVRVHDPCCVEQCRLSPNQEQIIYLRQAGP